MLSPEERRGLLEEAGDPRRREVLRRFRHRPFPVSQLLEALDDALALLGPLDTRPRHRPKEKPETFKL